MSDLTKKAGFKTRNPHAMTTAERQRRWRAKHGGVGINFYMHVEAAAASLYLRKQWGFKTQQELIEASLRYLAIQTRKGLTRLDLDIV